MVYTIYIFAILLAKPGCGVRCVGGKFQDARTKYQTNSKLQVPKLSICFEFGIWILIGSWRFGSWNLSTNLPQAPKGRRHTTSQF
jgi:hypothetical protein